MTTGGVQMNVQDMRRQRQSLDSNVNKFEFTQEKETLPNLHSGFSEECSKMPGKSAFFLSIWFSQGQYKACLLDRESQEKAFFNIGEIYDVLAVTEEALANDMLEWIPATEKTKGSWHN
jgi:hypothetical protein